MKKTIAMLLVAIMAVGLVFAEASALSGEFTSKTTYDIEDNRLFMSEDDGLEISFEITNGSANEGDIYASVKGKLTLALDQDEEDWIDSSKFEITEAAIYGSGWNLSVLKAADMPSYAAGWETYDDGDENVDLTTAASFGNGVGATLTVDNLLKAGAYVDVDFDDNAPKTYLGWVSTNDLAVGDLTLNVAAGLAGYKNTFNHIGLGAQVAYANDTISATVGTDAVIGISTDKNTDATFDMDVAASVAYTDLVTVDAYYATTATLGKLDTYAGSLSLDETGFALDSMGRGFLIADPEDYLSAKVAFDLNSFDVPVSIAVATLDIIDNTYIDVEGAFTLDAFDVTVFGGYQHIKNFIEVKANSIHAGATVGYDIENVGALSAGATYLCIIPDAKGADALNFLGFDLSLTNTTLISGATLKAGYKTANIIEDKDVGITSDAGEIYVQVKMTF